MISFLLDGLTPGRVWAVPGTVAREGAPKVKLTSAGVAELNPHPSGCGRLGAWSTTLKLD